MLKKDDMVQVIAGRDKGKSGKVLKVNSKTLRVTVEKVNLVKKHSKPTQNSPGGGILEKESPLHYSNVLLMCPKCGKGVRYGMKFEQAQGQGQGKKAKAQGQGKKGEKATAPEGKIVKTRVCKKCGESLG